MSTYVIGDVHGCHGSLRELLARLPFERSVDRLWLVGDLVNRGRRSLEVLRWATEQSAAMGGRFCVVLGNHDLHLLARAGGLTDERPGDTLSDVLDAGDAEALLTWLAARSLLLDDTSDEHGSVLMVHAGLLPSWTVEAAIANARAIEQALRGPERAALLRRKTTSDPGLAERQRGLDAFTRLRMCDAHGEPRSFQGPPEHAPVGLYPWYAAPKRRNRDALVLFGHWAALGFRRLENAIALDSGCVWGRTLSAVRVEDGELFRVAAVRADLEPT